MRPAEKPELLEGFRLLHDRPRPLSRLISLKVPEDLLEAFRARCRLEGFRYQTQIKRLMNEWLRGSDGGEHPARDEVK